MNVKTGILNNNKEAGYYGSFVNLSVASCKKVEKTYYNV